MAQTSSRLFTESLEPTDWVRDNLGMSQHALTVVDGPVAGAWIGPELSGAPGTVVASVPDRYSAYVRILHPVVDRENKRGSWELAAAAGRRTHPLVQWHAVVDSAPDGEGWQEPDRGNLAPDSLAALVEVLDAFTDRSELSYFGIWTGWSWASRRFFTDETGFSGKVISPLGNAISSADRGDERPYRRLCLPPEAGREYTILSGPLRDAIQIAGGISPSSPQLVWPVSRAWFVASEIDFDSTLVGGDENLIAAVLASPQLEAWRIGRNARLTFDADQVNRSS